MADLAIKGHAARGSEVIALLEMLGGHNIYKFAGYNDEWFYFINENNYINWAYPACNFKVFTLEEFFEKYPFKIGDRVTVANNKDDIFIVKEMSWIYDELYYTIHSADGRVLVNKSANSLEHYNKKIMEALNTQVGGEHYKKLAYQPVELFAKTGCTPFQANIWKYITRYKHKNGAQDIEKCIHYAQLAQELNCYGHLSFKSFNEVQKFCKANSLSKEQRDIVMFAYWDSYKEVINKSQELILKEYPEA